MLFLTFISWCAVRQSGPLRSDLVTSCCFKSHCGYFCQAVVILWGSVFTLELLLVTFCTLTHFVGFEVFCWGSRSLALSGFLCFTLMLFYVILFIFSVQRDTNSSKWQKTKFKNLWTCQRTSNPHTCLNTHFSFRVFRRRRRPRSSLVRLLSDVTGSCQSWLDEKVFRGVFGTVNNWNQKQEVDQDHDLDWSRSSPDGPACLDESWSPLNSTELEESRAFTYGG